MKYSININQYAALKNGLNLDIIDLAIFDFIKDFAASSKCRKMQDGTSTYMWISHRLIIDEMPTLGIKTPNGIKKHINKLIEADIIRRHDNCDVLGQTWYTFGANYDAMIATDDVEQNVNDLETITPVTKVTTPQQKLRDPVTKVMGPRNKSYGYNNNNNNNNNICRAETNSALQCEANKKTLFRNSQLYKSVKLDENENIIDFTEFEAHYKGAQYADIDLVHYFFAIADWSDARNEKRTNRGWISTVRQFIRRDADRNDIHKKQTPAQSNLLQEGLDYINFGL